MSIDIKKHKALGLCSRCTQPRKKGFIRCEKHLKLNREESAYQKKKRKEEGRCIDCGRQMNEDDFSFRRSKFRCVNCSEKTFYWR